MWETAVVTERRMDDLRVRSDVWGRVSSGGAPLGDTPKDENGLCGPGGRLVREWGDIYVKPNTLVK